MKILVTGGAGFVGTNLIKRLIREDHEVISVDNYSSGFKKNHQEGCIYFDMDLSESTPKLGSWAQGKYQLENIDLVFHMAALARIQPSITNPIITINNNFNSTLNILEWARIKNIPVVFAGSSSKHHGLWGSPYAWSKFGGEQLCELYNKVYNLPTATCRFYNVYGKHQVEDGTYATVIGIFEKQFREGKALTVVGTGEQRRDFTHIDDIVDGLVRCGMGLKIGFVQKNRNLWENVEGSISGEVFELGRGQNHSILEITKMFGETEVEYIPARPGEYDVTLADYSKANELLAWKPTLNLKDYINEVITK